MRFFACLMLYLFYLLGQKFVDAKIKNDSAIAADTKRIADALDGQREPSKTRHYRTSHEY